MCGTRNGWMAVLEGAQNVVDGVARAARATRNTVTASLFIYNLRVLRKALPCAPIAGAPVLLFQWRSDIEVQSELGGRRAQPHGIQLALDLVLDPGLDDVLGEDVALEQELVVLLQLAQRLFEGAGHLRHVLQLLRGEAVDVLVEGFAGIDPALDPVEAGHQHGGEREIRVAGGIGRTELRPLRLRTRRIGWDADRRRAIS